MLFIKNINIKNHKIQYMSEIIYEKYDNYWIYNDIIFIKPTFNGEISSSNFPLLLDDNEQIINKKLIQLCFSDYDNITKSINKYNFYKNFYNQTDIYIEGYTYDNTISRSRFNNLIDNLSLNLTKLTLGWNFNKSVYNLPNKLTHLTFGIEFDQPVNNLPLFLTHLDLGYNFSQSLSYLPCSLTHLILGYYFECSLDNLPNSITDVYISDHGYDYSDELNSKIKLHYYN
jgi:hypothetical protein